MLTYADVRGLFKPLERRFAAVRGDNAAYAAMR
jgi:hypothetical protein